MAAEERIRWGHTQRNIGCPAWPKGSCTYWFATALSCCTCEATAARIGGSRGRTLLHLPWFAKWPPHLSRCVEQALPRKLKCQVFGRRPLCGGGQLVSVMYHLFSQSLHTRTIHPLLINRGTEDGEDDRQWKQRKEAAEDQPRSIKYCPYTEDHCDYSNHQNFVFLQVRYTKTHDRLRQEREGMSIYSWYRSFHLGGMHE